MQGGLTGPQQEALNQAYDILRQEGRPLDTRTLLTRSLEASGELAPSTDHLAEAYTALNLDVRFSHAGKGNWGLQEWGKRREPSDEPAEIEGD